MCAFIIFFRNLAVVFCPCAGTPLPGEYDCYSRPLHDIVSPIPEEAFMAAAVDGAASVQVAVVFFSPSPTSLITVFRFPFDLLLFFLSCSTSLQKNTSDACGF